MRRAFACLLLIEALVAAEAAAVEPSALAELEAAAEAAPDDPNRHETLAWALRRAGRHEAAIAAFRRAIALAPSAERHHALAVLLERSGQERPALAAYGAALQLQGDHAPSLFGVGSLLLRAGRAGEAIDFLRASVQAERELLPAWYLLGRCHVDMGQWQQAEQVFRQVLSLDRQHLEARSQLIKALQAAGRRTERDQAIAIFYRLHARAEDDSPLGRARGFERDRHCSAAGLLQVEEHFSPLHGPHWRFRWQADEGEARELEVQLHPGRWSLLEDGQTVLEGRGIPDYDAVRSLVLERLGAD